MTKPIALLISDVHYSLNTKDIADTCFRMAIDKAAELGVPLIDCGDLTNDKAILRAEVVNMLLATLKYAKSRGVEVVLIVGNHSLVNEKAQEHALEFLSELAEVVDAPKIYKGLHLIPYFSDSEDLEVYLATIPKGSTVIMHQGVMGANMGTYIQDKTSLPAAKFKNFRVISGHYHSRQDIKCGKIQKGSVGLFSYVGNPYTLTFGEAADPVKGFVLLNSDNSLTAVPTNQRRHRVITCKASELPSVPLSQVTPEDLVWVKVTGSKSELLALSKNRVGLYLGLTDDFRLDLIPDEVVELEVETLNITADETLDLLIEHQEPDVSVSSRLKQLWRDLLTA